MVFIVLFLVFLVLVYHVIIGRLISFFTFYIFTFSQFKKPSIFAPSLMPFTLYHTGTVAGIMTASTLGNKSVVSNNAIHTVVPARSN